MSSNTPQTDVKAAPLAAQISVPQSKSDPSAVKVEEIPLPPVEMWAELDNSAPPPVASASGAAEKPNRTEEQPAPFEELEFIESDHQRVIPLNHPFRLNGKKITHITVRRLRMGEVDALVKKTAKGGMTTFDVYAEMTGLSASVLRGLIDEDGDAVTDAAFDFLPRMFRPDAASSAS